MPSITASTAIGKEKLEANYPLSPTNVKLVAADFLHWPGICQPQACCTKVALDFARP